MSVTHLAILVVWGLAPDADPKDLVTRLGSPRYAERQEAAAALERLGREALPALRGGLGARDPEVRTQAAAIASKIECDLMVRPTPVALDFRDRPLDEVVRAIAERSRVPVALTPENALVWQGRRVTLVEPEPVPFWTAIDRLCRAGQLGYSPLMPMGPGNSRRLLLQAAAGGGRYGPVCDSGPFRITLLTFDHRRTLDFNNPTAPAPARVIIGGLGDPPAIGPPPRAPARPAFGEQFSLAMQVLAEPRLMIAQSGPIKLLEAVDDQGRSLLPPAPPGLPIQRYAGYSGYSFGSSFSGLQIQVPLKPPDQPGQTLKALRGSIPLIVSARKPDALTVPLAGAAGQTFRAGEAALTVHEVKADPQSRLTTVELTVRSPDRPEAALPGALEPISYRVPELVQNRLEILDARGQVIPALRSQSAVAAGETRLTLTLQPTNGAGAATHVRYYDLARTTAEATFEFADIPMP